MCNPLSGTQGALSVWGPKPLPSLTLFSISSLAFLIFTDMPALHACIGSGMARQKAKEEAAGKIAHLFFSSSNSVSLCPELLVVLSVSCSQGLLQLSALLLQLCKPVSLRCQPLLQRTVYRQPLATNKADVCEKCDLTVV